MTNSALLRVGPKGVVHLPDWAWKALLKTSGVRSKKFRIQKKAVRRELHKLIRQALEEKCET